MPSALVRAAVCAALLATVAACGAEPRSATSTAHAAPVGVVDSVLPAEVSLGRFREGLPDPGGLRGGFRSRDALVAEFGRALFAADTAALAPLLLDRAEFAYLYYPASPFSRDPYRLDPEILWFQLQNGTGKGITRALRTFGGTGYEYAGYECEAQPQPQGRNRLWESCRIDYLDPAGQRLSGRFFGSILERDGRFKIVSYANPL